MGEGSPPATGGSCSEQPRKPFAALEAGKRDHRTAQFEMPQAVSRSEAHRLLLQAVGARRRRVPGRSGSGPSNTRCPLSSHVARWVGTELKWETPGALPTSELTAGRWPLVFLGPA